MLQLMMMRQGRSTSVLTGVSRTKHSAQDVIAKSNGFEHLAAAGESKQRFEFEKEGKSTVLLEDEDETGIEDNRHLHQLSFRPSSTQEEKTFKS